MKPLNTDNPRKHCEYEEERDIVALSFFFKSSLSNVNRECIDLKKCAAQSNINFHSFFFASFSN